MPGKILLATALLSLASPALIGEDAPSPVEHKFEQILSWEGRWDVAEVDALSIVFERTARGSTMVERWETASGLHSMTVYHLDGDAIVATHYCPQGNQPRLVAGAGNGASIAFSFLDVTGLDEGESHAHSLSFEQTGEETIIRSEIYLGPEGIGDPTVLTLIRSPDTPAD